MNTKYCPVCGKELPVEAAFCPYCMTKLIDVQTGTPIKVKNKYVITLIILVIIFVIAALTMIGTIMFFYGNDNKGTEPSESNTLPSDTSEPETNATSAPDYTKYIGRWSKSSDEVTIYGGTTLEVISVKDDILRFTFRKVSGELPIYIAIISNITCQIIDGTGTFTFDNDDWGNRGRGKIVLYENEIYLDISITDPKSDALYNIGGQFYLIPSDNHFVDIQYYLGKDFYESRNDFGEEQRLVSSSTHDMHVYNGLVVAVSQETNRIVSIEVIYSLTLSSYDYRYGLIDGNSTYEDVYANFGEPSYNYLSDGNVVYNIEGNGLKFWFDENMRVSSIIYQKGLLWAD